MFEIVLLKHFQTLTLIPCGPLSHNSSTFVFFGSPHQIGIDSTPVGVNLIILGVKYNTSWCESGIKPNLTGVEITTNLIWTSYNTGGVKFNTRAFAVIGFRNNLKLSTGRSCCVHLFILVNNEYIICIHPFRKCHS